MPTTETIKINVTIDAAHDLRMGGDARLAALEAKVDELNDADAPSEALDAAEKAVADYIESVGKALAAAAEAITEIGRYAVEVDALAAGYGTPGSHAHERSNAGQGLDEDLLAEMAQTIGTRAWGSEAVQALTTA